VNAGAGGIRSGIIVLVHHVQPQRVFRSASSSASAMYFHSTLASLHAPRVVDKPIGVVDVSDIPRLGDAYRAPPSFPCDNEKLRLISFLSPVFPVPASSSFPPCSYRSAADRACEGNQRWQHRAHGPPMAPIRGFQIRLPTRAPDRSSRAVHRGAGAHNFLLPIFSKVRLVRCSAIAWAGRQSGCRRLVFAVAARGTATGAGQRNGSGQGHYFHGVSPGGD